ncbi:MAG: Asp23/Gls24 family envelope stress response protein [Candidatus Omnitrophota bacterium]
MSLGEKVDLGNVHIHKKVIGDIAVASLKEIPGVTLAQFGFIGGFFEVFGYKNFPGVYVSIDQSRQISLEIRVEVDYGINIPLVAHQVQDKVQEAVEHALDIQLKEINVSIRSVERSLPAGRQGGS